MEKIWHDLYRLAKNKIDAKEIPPFISYGNTACAIESTNGQMYVGVGIVSNSSLNTIAEKNAITAMLNNGECKIRKMVILNELEEVIPPSPECLDYLLNLEEDFGSIEVLINYSEKKIVKLLDILPSWWGTYRNPK